MSKKLTAGIAVGGCAAILAFIALVYAICTMVTMAVWNWALVPLFHFPVLDWGQALLIYMGIGLVGGTFRGVTSRGN